MDRYHPSRDQVAVADSLRESLAFILPLSRLRETHEESSSRWNALSELGVFGVSLSEDRGGSGLGLADEALIVIELGRRVVTPSVLATIGAAPMRRTSGRVAAGYRRGNRVVFVDDSGADQLLVRGTSGAQLLELPKVSRLVDQTLWSCRLLEVVGPVECLAETDPAQALRLRLLDAAALAGLAQTALTMAVEYAGMREQFGRPIGSFQAIKHHCTNMALASRLASDQVSFAAIALDDRRDDAILQVESALYIAGRAAIDNASTNIQVHGGMGFSEEADPHRLLKRSRLLVEIAGGLEAAVTRIGAA